MEYFTEYTSPMGTLTLTGDDSFLTGLWLTPRTGLILRDDLPVFAQTKDWLDRYFRRQVPDPKYLPLCPAGTDFQKRVWQILLAIPFGESRSYGQLAREMARLLGKEKMSAQAVGNAVGRNPICIIIPCHRVLGAQGQITGYTGGLEYKRWLLRHEGIPYKEERT